MRWGTGLTGPARATFRLAEATSGPSADELPAEELDAGEPGTDEPGNRRDWTPAAGRWRLEFLLAVHGRPQPARARRGSMGGRRQPEPVALPPAGTAAGRARPGLPGLSRAGRWACTSRSRARSNWAPTGRITSCPSRPRPLDEAGFGVLLPTWWDGRRRLGLTASAHTPVDGMVEKAGRFGREQLMDFRWQLAVGDDTLTDEEIAALAAAKAPLVRLRGQWVAVDSEQLKRGLDFLARERSGQATAAEILRLAASHPDDLDTPLPLSRVTADGWLGELLGGSVAQSLRPVPVPDHFQAALRPYQERGAVVACVPVLARAGGLPGRRHGAGQNGAAAGPGGGAPRTATPATGPTLLLCPMSLVGNWQREAARFTPGLRVYAHHGPQRLRGGRVRLPAGRVRPGRHHLRHRDP